MRRCEPGLGRRESGKREKYLEKEIREKGKERTE
jgi:hypothetical protein